MRLFAVGVLLFLSGPAIYAETAQERLDEAAALLSEISASADKGIPQDLVEDAECVVVIPGMIKAALGVGGQYGRGFAICRTAANRGWGAPAAVRMEGGSFGLQLGASSTDLVMLVMNERGMNKLLESKFTLGADASVAAGPIGRTAAAKTDAQMGAEILAWSRSKGLFAGVSLSGATLRNDLDENKELYGRELTNREVLTSKMAPPSAASKLITQLNRLSAGQSADRSTEKR
jgi:lipid-binding SYLF domain-containing protein